MVTIKDIAKEVNLAPSTISHALRGTGTISAETRKKVLEAARRLDYPSLASKDDVKTDVPRIAVLTGGDDDNNEIFMRFWLGVTEEVGDPIFLISDAPRTSLAEHIIFESAYTIDGFIAYGFEPTEQIGEKMSKAGLKGVYINRLSQNSKISTVTADYLTSFGDIVDLLVEKGHRNIMFATYTDESWVKDRFQGYKERMNYHKLEAQVLKVSHYNDIMADFLGLPNRPTALVCVNDVLALAFMQEAEKNNVRIPDDVAVSGFDDLKESATVEPGLTTYRLPAERMGKEAARLVCSLAREEFVGCKLVIPAEFIQRGSI